jgi:uroporphyrinogen decarboxylase
MNKRERLAAAVAGQEVDRAPVALWRHFPVDDQHPETLAQSIAAFQQQYDWDFIKMTPSSHYSVADLGCRVAYRGNPHGTSDYLTRPITSPDQWEFLPRIVATTGTLGQQLTSIRRLRELVGPDVTIIETIFSPMDQARHLVGDMQEIVHLRTWPEKLRAGLDILTEMTTDFVYAALEAGADGIFYATQHARSTHLSREEYESFCRPYDMRILGAARDGNFNLFHLHGLHTYFDLVADYPVHALNWHDRDTGPSLAEGAKQFPGLVVGGVSQHGIERGRPHDIRTLAHQAIDETGGRRVCLATGCVIPITTPWSNIRALRNAVEE